MKKKLVALMLGACAVVIGACGTKSDDPGVSAVQPVPVESIEAAVESNLGESESKETVQSTDSPESTIDYGETNFVSWVGDWYEEKLGMYMTVAESGKGYQYVVRWPDSDHNMTFVWEINGAENEAGVVYYKNGVASVIEKDGNGLETTNVLSKQMQGNLALLEDGSLLWIEEVEVEVEHRFRPVAARKIVIDLAKAKELHPKGREVEPLTWRVLSEQSNPVSSADEWYEKEQLSLPNVAVKPLASAMGI